MASAIEFEECPLCGELVELAELPSHVDLCSCSLSDNAALVDDTELDSILCPQGCGQRIALADLDSHEEAHRIQQEVYGQGPVAAEEAALRAQIESEEFEKLRARHGFSTKRPGVCFVCGQQGHWRQDCPQNPKAFANQFSGVLPTTSALLAEAQRRETALALQGGGFIALLRSCLLAQTSPPGTCAYLCGELDAFPAQEADRGWGCGWRNTQVLASHLIRSREDARAELFGGKSYVPDIVSLQAWLEAAWAAGFDGEGAEQLGGAVQRSRKWIGTTEVAALLRQFGLRAHIIQFRGGGAGGGGSGAGGGGSGRAAGLMRTAGDSACVHVGVACDLCSVAPLVGVRHTSLTRHDYDVCSACIGSDAANRAAPFRLTGSAGGSDGVLEEGEASASEVPTSGPRGRPRGTGGLAAQHPVVQWVWRYFSEGPPWQESGYPGGDKSFSMDGASGASGGGGGSGCSDYAGDSVQVRDGDTAAQGSRDAFEVLRGGRAGGTCGASVSLTGLAPLYLQHHGHSRTVVGVERRGAGTPQEGYSLLVLDPGTPGHRLQAVLSSQRGWQAVLKRGGHTLSKPDYQLLAVLPGLAQGEELQGLKRMTPLQHH